MNTMLHSDLFICHPKKNKEYTLNKNKEYTLSKNRGILYLFLFLRPSRNLREQSFLVKLRIARFADQYPKAITRSLTQEKG